MGIHGRHKNCEYCQGRFSRKKNLSYKQWDSRRFCSNLCSRRSRAIGKRKIVECLSCGKKLSKTLYQINRIKRSEGNCCSRECLQKYIRENNLWNEKNNPFYGKHHTEQTKTTLRQQRIGISTEHNKGSKCHFWRGGNAKRNNRERNRFMATVEYRNWKRKVHERDDYMCQECGIAATKGNRIAHHIKEYEHYPDLRTEVSNGLTLCRDCHYKTDSYGRRGLSKST